MFMMYVPMKSGKRMERLILLTPRIVKPDQSNVPKHADYKRFRRSPTQADYTERAPYVGRTARARERTRRLEGDEQP